MQPEIPGIPAEFELVLACARWPHEPPTPDRLRELAGKVGWPLVVEMAAHHKVIPQLARCLEAVAPDAAPPREARILRAGAVGNACLCSQHAAFLQRIHRRLGEAHIGYRVLKGIPLAVLAYADPQLRDVGDIDLLISPGDLQEAERILLQEGFLRSEPEGPLTPRRLRAYLAHQKDFSFRHPSSRIALDLHWRLFRNPLLPGNAEIAGCGMQAFSLGGESIPALPTAELFLYLCQHGALDGWLRLKWICDIAFLLRSLGPDEWERTSALAAERGILPELAAAVLLSEELLGARLPARSPALFPSLAQLEAGRPATTRILRFAHKLLRSNGYRPAREAVAGPAWFFNELFLHSGLRYRLELLWRALFRPRVWQAVDLPDWLFPLYAILSPLEWIAFRLRRAARGPERSGPASGRRLLFRLFDLKLGDAALAVEAAGMLLFFRVALRFLSVQRLTAWMGAARRPGRASAERNAGDTLRRIEWAMDAVVRHSPLTFVCFPQSLAAYFMLRRRGIAGTLFYGVARGANRLQAHTWIKVGDRIVVGGEGEPQFTVLTTFP